MLEINVGVKADFDVIATKADGSRRKLYSGDNLITNVGMNKLGAMIQTGNFRDSFGNALQIGTGTTAPAFTDTALTTRLAAVANVGASAINIAWGSGADDGYVVLTYTYEFAVGSATGVLAELGMASNTAASGYELHTHALFVDGGGSPAPVTVLADEGIIVLYRLKFRHDTADKVFTTTTSPTPVAYTITMRPLNYGQVAGLTTSTSFFGPGTTGQVRYGATSGLGPYTGDAVGTAGSLPLTRTFSTYVANSFTRDITYAVAAGVGNFAQIGALTITSGGTFHMQMGFSPRFTKVSPETLRWTIRWTWSRL